MSEIKVRRDGHLPGLPWTVRCVIPCDCRNDIHVADARMAWAIAEMRSQRRAHRKYRQEHTNPQHHTQEGEAA